ncbi:MAG: helix-turn-helix domain-containing protein [Clostridiales bacterium]|nr:helix-turn-helix domain-containing protein [Clostridiales bacterium]
MLTIGQENYVTPVGKRTYSVEEVRAILDISRRKAYELCNSDCFKVIRVGRTMRISKASFDYWLDHYEEDGGQSLKQRIKARANKRV